MGAMEAHASDTSSKCIKMCLHAQPLLDKHNEPWTMEVMLEVMETYETIEVVGETIEVMVMRSYRPCTKWVP